MLLPALPFVVTLDDCDDPGDVIDGLALGPFTAGAEPFSRSIRLNRVRPDATLLPPAVPPGRRAESNGRVCLLATGEGWSLKVVRWRSGSADLTVTAMTDELGAEILAAACSGACLDPAPEDDAVNVGFWNQTRCGNPNRTVRQVAVNPWAEIRSNYPRSCAESLSGLMDTAPALLSGRLLLLHGPPGTGKTTVLRSLAHAWRKWCATETILDPERLLEEPGYLMTVVLGDDDDGDDRSGDGPQPVRRHRLLVLEDCDELIRSDAKKDVGQSLARLLNLTDGMLGQGLDVLVAVTTNEPLIRLHPAIVRPGRCLAEVHVGRFPRTEAIAWLGTPTGIGPDGATLAELYALHRGPALLPWTSSGQAVGQYL